MMIYVFEQWMEGEWRPKFIWRFTSFRGALKVLHSNYRKDFLYRVKRVKTLEELKHYESQGVTLYNKKNVLGELWKVEWVS